MPLSAIFLSKRLIAQIVRTASDRNEDYWITAGKIFKLGLTAEKKIRRKKTKRKTIKPEYVSPKVSQPVQPTVTQEKNRRTLVPLIAQAESSHRLMSKEFTVPDKPRRVAYATVMRHRGLDIKSPKLIDISEGKKSTHISSPPSIPQKHEITICSVPLESSTGIIHQIACSEPNCNAIFPVSDSDFHLLREARVQGKGRPKCEVHGGIQTLIAV